MEEVDRAREIRDEFGAGDEEEEEHNTAGEKTCQLGFCDIDGRGSAHTISNYLASRPAPTSSRR